MSLTNFLFYCEISENPIFFRTEWGIGSTGPTFVRMACVVERAIRVLRKSFRAATPRVNGIADKHM